MIYIPAVDKPVLLFVFDVCLSSSATLSGSSLLDNTMPSIGHISGVSLIMTKPHVPVWKTELLLLFCNILLM